MSENHTSSNETNESPESFTPPRHWLGSEELNAGYWNDPATKEKRSQEFYDKPIETIALIEKLDPHGRIDGDGFFRVRASPGP